MQVATLLDINRALARVFPDMGQIAYALLTRPPLAVFLRLVRLECVRHAASVHPEPGSNSPVIIINRLSPDLCFLPERFSCSITFSSFSKFLFGFLALSPSYFYQVFRCLKFCCSIFKDRAPVPSRKFPPFLGRAFLFYYLPFRLSSGFFNFFRVFGKNIAPDPPLRPASAKCARTPPLSPFFRVRATFARAHARRNGAILVAISTIMS